VAKTVSFNTSNRGAPPLAENQAWRQEFKEFYEAYYNDILAVENRPCNDHLYTAIEYMAIEILTMYSNNVIQRFDSYVRKYIDCIREKRHWFQQIDEDLLLTRNLECRLRQTISFLEVRAQGHRLTKCDD
jgi:hypothetical protein